MTAQLTPPTVQRFFDNQGNPLTSGFVYTYGAGTVTPQASYLSSTISVGNQQNNPVQLNARGEAPIWLDPSLTYKINVTDQSGNQLPGWPIDNIPGGYLPIGQLSTYITQNFIGQQLYPQTSAEIAAGVTPTNYAYPAGYVYRYGINTTPGTTDMTTAFNTAANVCRQGNYSLILAPDKCLVSGSLNFSNIHVIGTAFTSLANNVHIQATSAQFNVITSTGGSHFENFVVDGGWNGVTAGLTGYTFYLVGSPFCYDIKFDNVVAQNNKQSGCFWQSGGYSYAKHFECVVNGLHGIELFGPDLAHTVTTIHIFGNSRFSTCPNGYGAKLTECIDVCFDNVIMEGNAHSIQLNGNDNRTLTFRNVYLEVITDNNFLDGTGSAGNGLCLDSCYFPGGNVIGLSGWLDVYYRSNVLASQYPVPFPNRILQNDGGQQTLSTTGGVNFTAASISLPPGTYLVFGSMQTLAGTGSNLLQSAINITNNVAANGLNNATAAGSFAIGADEQTYNPGGSMDHRLNCFAIVQVTATTTWYLRGYVNFSGAGNMTYHGFLYAVLFE